MATPHIKTNKNRGKSFLSMFTSTTKPLQGVKKVVADETMIAPDQTKTESSAPAPTLSSMMHIVANKSLLYKAGKVSVEGKAAPFSVTFIVEHITDEGPFMDMEVNQYVVIPATASSVLICDDLVPIVLVGVSKLDIHTMSLTGFIDQQVTDEEAMFLVMTKPVQALTLGLSCVSKKREQSV